MSTNNPRPPLPTQAAEYLAHRYADMRQAKPNTKSEAAYSDRFTGACEVIAALGVVHTNSNGVWMAVQDAYDRCGPRPPGGAPLARREWVVDMTAAVIEEVGTIQ